MTPVLDDDKRIQAHDVLQPVVNSHSLSLDVGHEAHVLHPDVLAEGGAEHHDLLLVGGGSEYLLNITAHV